MRRALAVAAFLLVFESVAQPPTPYFALNSDRTYAPGEKPRVMLSSNNVDALEFRVYRVNDPVEFFKRLPEPHGFGGQAPPVPPARTLLEKIHRWKERTRFSMRRLMRDQFGDEEHQQIAAWFGRAPRVVVEKGASVGTQFAEVPLLNPQQLIKTWRVPVSKKNQWDSQNVEFDVPGGGLYIVEAVANGLRAATVVNVTPLVLLKKVAPGKVITQVVDRQTGLPVEGIDLHLVRERADTISKKSNGEGIAEFELKVEGDTDLTVVARRGADSAMISIESWPLRENRDQLAIGYIYTDRPVYRPGDKVGFRGILRGEDANGWKMPDTADIDCEIMDPEGKPIFKRALMLSEFGTVAGEWTSAKSAALGYYSVNLRSGESTHSGGFQIEEYKKPEYEVKVSPSQPRVLQGEKIEFKVEAKYYFGEPVSNAKVHYTVRTSRHWSWFWDDYDPADYGDDGDEQAAFYGEQIAEADAKLDAQGRMTIQVPTKQADFDQDYRIQVGVTDEAKREITGRGVSLATVGTFVLVARPEKYVYSPGEAIRLKVDARDYDNKPVSGIAFRYGSFTGTTDANGTGNLDIGSLKAGSHKLKVTSGRVSSDVWIWVSGNFSMGATETKVTLVPDKKSYKPGETAKVLVVTGVPNANVMLGIEGRSLHQMTQRKSGETSFIFEVPIKSEYAPNIFVTAAFLKDGKYFFGSKSLKIPPTEKLIQVAVKPSLAQFKPGQPASYTIEAKDHLGKPVAAEFSLGVVDEAIYGVEPDTTQPIDKAFYGPIYDRVFTDSSLNYYFYGQSGKRPMPIARLAKQHSMAQVKPPNPNDPRVRKLFDDTALWLASVKTDANGKAEAKLQFPDSITAWRATARGVTRNTHVGSAVNRVITRKDLILRLATPRFFTEGDEVVVSAIVNNYLEGEKKVRISLEATGLEPMDGTTREGVAPPKVETPFLFRLKAKGGELATLTAKAITDEESDALEISLPIEPYGVKITNAHSGVITNSGTADQTIAFPANTAGHAMEIRAMPSMAGAIFGALEYLTSYPYGCTEQTLSSFVPTTLVDQALRELKLSGGVDRVRLTKQIQAGLDRLADFQHPDGGWGFWQTDDSGAFMTANVIASLDACGRWGRANPEKAKEWLRQAFAKEKRADADFRAFLAFALNEAGPLDEVWRQNSQLSPYGLALIGIRSDGARANEIAERLEKSATVSETEVYWKMTRDPIMDLEWDASPDATASALKFLTRVRPQSPLLAKIAQWLVNHRDSGYYWSSTKQTATVVYGLIDYLKMSGELNPKLAGSIKVNGEQVWNKELTQADALSLNLPGLRIVPKQASNKVEIESSGTGRLYWSASGIHYDAQPRFQNSRELSVRREYFRVVSGGTMVAFDGAAKPGDEIVSRLTVSGADWRYLMIEDPIPAGAEWVKEQRWWGTYKELRDNRAVIFETYFNKSRTYENRMKFTRPGKFRISPARVSPMYQPNVMAVSDPSSVEVLP